MSEPSPWEGIVALIVVLVPVGYAIASMVKGRLAPLTAAFLLVLWGLFIATVEHVGFGRLGFGGSSVLTHERFHFQMLAAYGLVALALVGLVVAPLVREGRKVGWCGLLVVFVMGVGAEVLSAAITTPHGVPPRWWSWGLAIWGYPVAWATALVVSWRPTFRV